MFTFCIECGGYLDRDESICRACGADNAPEAWEALDADDGSIWLDASLKLDQLGEWSHVKHEIVSKYGSAYATIMSRQKFIKRFVYADGFAGSGVALDKSTGELVAGSALRALEIVPPFSEYHFIELDDKKRDQLRRSMAGRPNVLVHHGDCNQVLVDRVLPRCRYEDFARGLCLLDPYGLSVDYDVVKAAGRMGTVEIFFNFMLVSANRNVLWTNPARVPRRRWPILTKAWGGESWRTDLYEHHDDLFGGVEQKVSNERVVEKYRERLLAAGFKHVPQPIPMRNSQGAAIYYLFFASPNQTGADIVEDVFSKYR
jgi:three-Cys-motif partner protein